MSAGDRLEMVREPGNPHDPNAVRVEWRGRMLGYLPRMDNAAVARQLDRGAALQARIARLKENRNRSLRLVKADAERRFREQRMVRTPHAIGSAHDIADSLRPMGAR